MAPQSCSRGSCGKLDPGVGLDDGLELLRGRAPVVGGKLRVERVAFRLLQLLKRFFEDMMLDAEHDGGIHLDEAAIAVPGEAGVSGIAGQSFDCLVVEAEIEHRVHHAGHGGAGARADGDEQGPFGVVEGVAGDAADLGHGGVHLRFEVRREAVAVGVEKGADFGGDRETRRNGEAQRGHLGQICALAAEKLPHGRRPFGATRAETIHPLGHCFRLPATPDEPLRLNRSRFAGAQ